MVTRMTETELEQYYDAQDEEQVREQSGLIRIHQLEKQCAVLAAEVDRTRPIVDAARSWYNGASGWSVILAEAVADYETAKET